MRNLKDQHPKEKIENFKKRSSQIQSQELDKNLNENKNLILLKDISFSYGDNQKDILKNINLNIEKGTIVGITGETGSGKSTLFHIMLGLLSPKTGKILDWDTGGTSTAPKHLQTNLQGPGLGCPQVSQ